MSGGYVPPPPGGVPVRLHEGEYVIPARILVVGYVPDDRPTCPECHEAADDDGTHWPCEEER